jgi:hypothetical protein
MKIYDRICAYFIIFAIVLIIAACVGNTSNTPVSHSEEGVEITDTLNGNYVKPSVIVHNGHRYLIFFYFADNPTVIHDPECEKKDMLWVLQHQHSHLNTD